MQPVAYGAELCAYDDYLQFYTCKSGHVTQVTDAVSGDFNVLLEEYNADSIYRIDFTVSSNADVSPTFYVDYGNGPENDTSLQINMDKYVF